MIREIKVCIYGLCFNMILIVDDTAKKRSAVLREELFADYIPCLVCKSEDIRKYPEALAAFVFVSTEDQLKTVCLRCGRIPVLAVNESGSRIYNKDVLFYDAASGNTYAEFIYEFLKTRFGITVGCYLAGEIELEKGGVRVGMVHIKLTKTERRILACLMICRDRWIPESLILKACFNGSTKCKDGLAAVHICNINKKANLVFSSPLILTKRGQGYMLNMTI